MRKFVFLLALLSPLFGLQAATLDIRVKGINSDKGQIQLALFDREREFQLEKGRPYAVQIFPAQRGTMRFVFANLPPGRYAVKLHHDADGDEIFDMRGALPAEGYGYFKNLGRRGIPDFEDANILMRLADEQHQTEIKMIYL